jgi:hypothetical protein
MAYGRYGGTAAYSEPLMAQGRWAGQTVLSVGGVPAID